MTAGDEHDPIMALPLSDQLYHAIGRVAQQQVWLDAQLRVVHSALAAANPGTPQAGEREPLSVICAKCETLLDAATLPPEVMAAVRSTLDATTAEDKRRHRVVHDLFRLSETAGSGGGAEFKQLRSAGGNQYRAHERDLESIHEVADELQRCFHRVNALLFVLPVMVLGATPFPGEPEYLDELLQTMEGRFTLNPDGSAHLD